jgi:Ran GTPase-activating protein (RanGAP) involved in mRNA processing and transport
MIYVEGEVHIVIQPDEALKPQSLDRDDDFALYTDEISERIDVDKNFVVTRFNEQRRRSCVADFNNLNLSSEVLMQLLQIFQNEDSFKDLVLSSNRLDLQKCNLLRDILSSNSKMIFLDLSNCLIGDEGMDVISEIFKVNCTIQTLVLEHNFITENGIDGLCDALQKNSSLTSLNLSRNQLGPIGAQKLASAMLPNKSIRQVNLNKQLKGAKIGPDGATAFSRLLRRDSCNLSILQVSVCKQYII